MDNRTEEKNSSVSIDKDTKIQLIMTPASDASETEIDLGRVFDRMKGLRRVYGWVLALFVVAGVSLPLLMYQFSHKMLTVASVVTLDYNVQIGNSTRTRPVTDLTAPDGKELDLGQVTSSYVIRNALKGMNLSAPVTIDNLQANLKVTRLLTEDSRRAQEVVASLLENKNAAALTESQNLKPVYQNRFVVTLTNGFGDEDARFKTELPGSELRELLDRILTEYNKYLALTYQDPRLPDDQLSFIDTEHLDLMESLDQLKTAEKDLYTYCTAQPDNIRSYRSGRTGLTLTDWTENLLTVNDNNINYLYSYVYANNIVLDRNTVLNNYLYQQRTAQQELDKLNEDIASTQHILDSYKNDDVFVSLQESDTVRSTTVTTDYYNQMVLLQAEQYAQAAALETTLADLQSRVQQLQNGSTSDLAEFAQEELVRAIGMTSQVYQGIRDHMTEVFASSESASFINHSAPYGKDQNFLTASLRNLIIGAAAGLILAFGLWFLAALAPEFHRKEPEASAGKEAIRP